MQLYLGIGPGDLCSGASLVNLASAEPDALATEHRQTRAQSTYGVCRHCQQYLLSQLSAHRSELEACSGSGLLVWSARAPLVLGVLSTPRRSIAPPRNDADRPTQRPSPCRCVIGTCATAHALRTTLPLRPQRNRLSHRRLISAPQRAVARGPTSRAPPRRIAGEVDHLVFLSPKFLYSRSIQF